MDNEVREFLEYLKSRSNKEKAYFGIFQYGGGSDESFIKANEEGVLQFLQDLTMAYVSIKENQEKGETEQKNTYGLNYDEDWVDGDSGTFLQYLELTRQERSVMSQEVEQSTFADKLVPLGCIGLLTIIASCTVIGFGTVISWIFK